MSDESNMNNENSENKVSQQSTISIGEQFKQAREAKHWTIEDVASKLCYSKSWIVHLENDRFSEFSALAYARGYVRSYAKLLGLPTQPILDSLANHDLGYKTDVRPPELILTRQASINDGWVRWVSYAIAASLVLLVILWWHSLHSGDTNLHSAISISQKTTSEPTDVPLKEPKKESVTSDSPVVISPSLKVETQSHDTGSAEEVF